MLSVVLVCEMELLLLLEELLDVVLEDVLVLVLPQTPKIDNWNPKGFDLRTHAVLEIAIKTYEDPPYVVDPFFSSELLVVLEVLLKLVELVLLEVELLELLLLEPHPLGGSKHSTYGIFILH